MNKKVDRDQVYKNYKRYSKDPWAFITECVYTQDQVDQENPVKLFPNKKYIKTLVRVWQKYKKIAVPKSRRMTVSWTAMALYAWVFVFKKSQSIAFVSKKEDDADKLVKRLKFILDNIPEEKLPRELIPKYSDKYCSISSAETYNEVMGFPMGADQLRQFTFSHIFGDEAAFWEKAMKFYSASLPTIDGGGSMFLVSSPSPGFFKQLVFDQLDAKDTSNIQAKKPSGAQTPSEGVNVWINKKNKFLVFELHYTADPTKRQDAYKQSLKDSLPLQEYLREYELYWDTFEGAPVYPEFNSKFHVNNKRTLQHGLPLLIGFDFGLTPAAVVGQYAEDVLYLDREFVEVNMGAQRFMEKLVPQLRTYYPEWDDFKKNWFCFIDPAGFNRDQSNDMTSCALEVGKYFNPVPGPINFNERIKSVNSFMLKINKEGARFQVNEDQCPVLVQGFKGGYRYPEKAIEVEPSKLRPVKDAYSHPQDAVQYLSSGATALIKKYAGSVPKPSYYFAG